MAMLACCLQRFLTPQGGGLLTALRGFSTTQALHIMKRPKFLGPMPDFKRPASPYTLYIQECSKTQPLDMKLFAANWKSLSDNDKQAYKMKFDAKKKEYDELYEEFLQKQVGGKKMQEAYQAELKEYKAKMREYVKQFKLKKMNLLKPRKLSGYALFTRETIKSSTVQSKENSQAMIASIADKWKNAGKMEQMRYNALADSLHDAELKAYEKRYRKAIKDGVIPTPKEEVAKVAKKPAKTKSKAAAKKTTKTTAKKTAKKAAKKSTKTKAVAQKAEKSSELFSSDSDNEVSGEEKGVEDGEELFTDLEEVEGEEVMFDGSTEYEGDEELDEEMGELLEEEANEEEEKEVEGNER